MRAAIATAVMLLACSASNAGELDIYPPTDVPGEWRRLAAEYQTQMDKIKEDRKARGEKAKTLDEQLKAIDWAAVREQADEDMRKGYEDLLKAVGEGAQTYLKGPGKRDNVIDTGMILINDAVPAFKQMYEAQFAEVDMMYEADRMQDELNQHNREIADFDKKIADLQKNIDLSEKIADTYEAQVNATKKAAKEVVFKLVDKATLAKEAVQQKHDTVPPGWTACSCPDAHSDVGRIIKGVRYHAQGYNCPL